MECVATRTKHFNHLPSGAFLCVIPQGSVRRSTSGRFVELQQGPFGDIFNELSSEKDAVIAAVRGLLRPSRKHRQETVIFEEAEE
jgi:hypothetical protein